MGENGGFLILNGLQNRLKHSPAFQMAAPFVSLNGQYFLCVCYHYCSAGGGGIDNFSGRLHICGAVQSLSQMGQALLCNPKGQPHFFRELAVLLNKYHIKGSDEYNHTYGVHYNHRKSNQLNQSQSGRDRTGDKEDDYHLPCFGQGCNEKDSCAVYFP